jgi:hypothetical protein
LFRTSVPGRKKRNLLGLKEVNVFSLTLQR